MITWRNKVDILLGIMAWSIALAGILLKRLIPDSYADIVGSIFIPVLWSATVYLMMAFRRRSTWKLWWAWLSAPLAFVYLLFYLVLLIAWS